MATDLTNKKFGHLMVLGLDTSKSTKKIAKSYWLCQCDCENKTIKSIRGDHLTSGETISCGCEQKIKSGRKIIDMTGKTFGRLEVLERSNKTNSSERAYWKCKCQCGNIVEVDGSSLRNGDTKSCGCLKREILSKLYTEMGKNRKIDLTNQTFGYLTVIKEVEERQGKEILWLCRCKCGNEVKVQGNNLRSGHTCSCGCLNKSKNEIKIEQMLKENNIKYITQYNSYERFRFDFYVDNKYIIEYDGEQHFNSSHEWKEGDFNITRKNDLIKNKYCFDNNIPLIRIPYDVNYTIDDLKLETTRFLLTSENEEEYYKLREE